MRLRGMRTVLLGPDRLEGLQRRSCIHRPAAFKDKRVRKPQKRRDRKEGETMTRLLVRNARMVVKGRPVIRQILIDQGRISRVAVRIKVDAERNLNAEGNFVIPGVIDPHVHFREPGLNHKEDWMTGSRAAAAGGVTTVLDMPNVKPPTFTVKRLQKKRALASTSIVNYGFHFGASAQDNTSEIRKARGVASTKVYMNSTTGNLLVEDIELIRKIFSCSRMVTAHAEEQQLEDAVRISKETNKRLYLCHVTLAKELAFLKRAKNRHMFCEATPHHLFLSSKDEKKLRGFGMMKPVLKSEKDRRALWAAVNRGLIDAVGSDHAPHLLDEKKSAAPPSGVTGLETMLPLLLDAFNKRNISLSRIVELTSRNPARIFGLRNKGSISPGYDADLCILDLNMKKKVRNDELHTKCGWSPFDGWILKGWPMATIVNGNIVFEKGDIFDIKAKEVEYDEV
ncbi:amidohydrolase family protein [Candidatus Woesearchaeota archaeon]|nr:amidohydrolase family protein [Candidatus Woesearchaeota archaeon]